MSSNIRINRKCQFCGKDFIAKTTVTKCCSDSCAKGAYKDKKKRARLETSQIATKLDSSGIEPIKDKQFFNIIEAAILIGCSRWTIHRLIKGRTLAAKKIGARTVITRQAIHQLFNI